MGIIIRSAHTLCARFILLSRSLTMIFCIATSIGIAGCGLDGPFFKALDNKNDPIPGADGPQAIIDAPAVAGVHSPVILSAANSYDPKEVNLTYAWALPVVPVGSVATLSNTTSSVTSLYPDKSGRYTVTLTVTNGAGLVSGEQTHTVDVVGTGGNHAPVAIATATPVSGMVIMDATQSYDADGNPISYEWSLISIPTGATGSISGGSGSVAYLNGTPNKTFAVRLVVRDHLDTDIIHLNVTPAL